jgi:hypothetical protein
MGIVIGLTGYCGVGKDEAARGLIDRGWVRVAFADAVKELALECNPTVLVGDNEPWPLVELVEEFGWGSAKTEPAVREFIQNLGDGAREVLGNDVWAFHAMNVAAIRGRKAPGIVFTDVRYPNEVEFIERHYGRTPEWPTGIVRITKAGVGPVNGHISERHIDAIEADLELVNDGTPDELRAKLVAYAESLEGAVCQPTKE